MEVSVIIRTFNNGEFIKKAVDSALNQTIDKGQYEIIVVNDGSTDDTHNILESFGDKIVLINQKNKGMVKSGYIGLENSKGSHIIFLDGDDEFKKDALSELFNALKENKECGFSYCDYYEMDLRNGSQKIVSLENIYNSLAGGILFKRSVLEDIGFWDRSMSFPEHDLMIRMLKKYKGVHVKKPLFVYKRHEGSFTDDKERVEKGLKEIFDKHGFIEGFKKY